MKTHNTIAALALALGALLLAPAAGQADGRATMREIISSHGDAVVRVELVQNIKASFGGRQNEYEQRSEVNGFFVGEDGLLVTTLSSVDQGQFYSSMTQGEDSFVTELRSAKFIMADNSEINAAIVLRDTDRDIVFFKPIEEGPATYPHFTLAEVEQPKILDETYTIARTSRISRRTLLGMSGEVQGIITRPRAYYIPHGELATAGSGTPMFNAQGQVIGMGGMYLFPGGRAAVGAQDEPYMFIIVPTADILDIIDDARAATPEATATPAAAEAEETPSQD